MSRIAQEVGTPVYVYSTAMLDAQCHAFQSAFKTYETLPCYAVKANSNLSVMRAIAAHGFGADVVSIGELERALIAGIPAQNIVYSGVGKRPDEIKRALEADILSFNVESEFELSLIETIAQSSKKLARVSLRINPNIDAKTHPKIATGLYSTKFGLAEAAARSLLPRFKNHPNLKLVGLGCHIGSQITSLEPIAAAAARMANLATEVLSSGYSLELLNMGGGLGIRYASEVPPTLESYAATLINAVRPTGLRLIVEPGRVLVGHVGVMLTTVLGVKTTPERSFIVVDAAMNDLVRPSLYGSFHDIQTIDADSARGDSVLCDVVGPVCESGDFLGKDRQLIPPKAGSLMMIRSCGAYGSSMASNYNSRPRAAEVMVEGSTYRIVRPREVLAEQWKGEL